MAKSWQDEAAKNSKGGGDGSGVRRFKIKPPEKGEKTKVRIRIPVNNFEPAWCHWFPGFNNEGEESDRFAICLGKKKGENKCPICTKFDETGDKGYKAKKMYFINVINKDGKDLECLLWTLSPNMFNQIAEVADPDEGMSDPTMYDIIIVRTGAKFKDTRYKVKAAMKDGKVNIKKISDEIEELLAKDPDDGGPYPLDKFVEKKTAEELDDMLSGQGQKKKKKDDDDDDDKPKKKKKDEDDEDDDDDKPKKKKNDDDDEDDDDIKPKKKNKHADEDDDEDDDKPKKKKKDEDEDDDDEPKKKKGKDKDDDEDDDEDGEDEDDKPKKKKKRDDDDEDDD